MRQAPSKMGISAGNTLLCGVITQSNIIINIQCLNYPKHFLVEEDDRKALPACEAEHIINFVLMTSKIQFCIFDPSLVKYLSCLETMPAAGCCINQYPAHVREYSEEYHRLC